MFDARKHRTPVQKFGGLLLICAIAVWPVAVYGDDSAERSFVDSIAATVYAFAWPTATYESVTFGSATAIDDGVLVSFRLHGKSAFDDGPLWVDVLIEIKHGEVTDLRWGRNNAILAAPGSTMKALGEMLTELNKGHRQPGATPMTPGVSSGDQFRFTNNCSHPVQLAIRYKSTTRGWRTAGWWSFAPGETGKLSAENGELLRSTNAIWYYYAETTDSAGFKWSGDNAVKVGARELRMKKMTEERGDSAWTITCN